MKQIKFPPINNTKEIKIDFNLYHYAIQHYTWDETFYNEIVKDGKFSYYS